MKSAAIGLSLKFVFFSCHTATLSLRIEHHGILACQHQVLVEGLACIFRAVAFKFDVLSDLLCALDGLVGKAVFDTLGELLGCEAFIWDWLRAGFGRRPSILRSVDLRRRGRSWWVCRT